MKTIFFTLTLMVLVGCASEQTKAYEKARYEANPYYNSPSNQTEPPPYRGEDYKSPTAYFACLLRYNQIFSSTGARYICDEY